MIHIAAEVHFLDAVVKLNFIHIVFYRLDQAIPYGLLDNPVADGKGDEIGEQHHEYQRHGKPKGNFKTYRQPLHLE